MCMYACVYICVCVCVFLKKEQDNSDAQGTREVTELPASEPDGTELYVSSFISK